MCNTDLQSLQQYIACIVVLPALTSSRSGIGSVEFERIAETPSKTAENSCSTDYQVFQQKSRITRYFANRIIRHFAYCPVSLFTDC